MSETTVSGRFEALRAQVELALTGYLTDVQGDDGPIPGRLSEAMRYAVLGGGKRMRPILALAACEAVGGEASAALPFACALELIHAYSLVHDDLPCMDDDAERRGKPTVHVAWDEATAVLVGDGLLTLAFELVSSASGPAEARLAMVRLLAKAAGVCGMVGGQQYDIEAAAARPTVDEVRRLHAMKTGALFRAAVVGGGIAGGADAGCLEALRRYGVAVGRAFQVTDDLLELEAGALSSGSTHEDNVSLAVRLGLEAARAEAKALTGEALAVAEGLGGAGVLLAAIAAQIEARKS